MRRNHHKTIWFASTALVVVGVIALLIANRSSVRLQVVTVHRSSSLPKACCEISNRGNEPIELTIHSIDQSPFCQRLLRTPFSWRTVLNPLDWRSAFSWKPSGFGMECGIDAQTKVLAPGETFPFSVLLLETNRPIRFAINYRIGKSNYTASSQTVFP
jgi:hypothetical protein